MGVDGRIVDVAEQMVRQIYRLNEEYVVKSYAVKSSSIELAISNTLVDLKIKLPVSIVEDRDYYLNEMGVDIRFGGNSEEAQEDDYDDVDDDPKESSDSSDEAPSDKEIKDTKKKIKPKKKAK